MLPIRPSVHPSRPEQNVPTTISSKLWKYPEETQIVDVALLHHQPCAGGVQNDVPLRSLQSFGVKSLHLNAQVLEPRLDAGAWSARLSRGTDNTQHACTQGYTHFTLNLWFTSRLQQTVNGKMSQGGLKESWDLYPELQSVARRAAAHFIGLLSHLDALICGLGLLGSLFLSHN